MLLPSQKVLSECVENDRTMAVTGAPRERDSNGRELCSYLSANSVSVKYSKIQQIIQLSAPTDGSILRDKEKLLVACVRVVHWV